MTDICNPSSYPPGPVLLLVKVLDVVCDTLQCKGWRNLVPFGWAEEPCGWLSHHVGDFKESFPSMLSYQDFLQSRGSANSFQSLWKFAFGTPSTELAVLTTPSAAFVLFLLVALLRSFKAIMLPRFSRIGRLAGRKRHGMKWEKNNEERIVKFSEYMFRLLNHSIICVFGICCFWDREWWDSSRGGTSTLFLDYPFHEVDVGLTWYYLIQSAYHLDNLLSLLVLSFVITFQNPFRSGSFESPVKLGWSNTVRGDFWEMAVHHVVTNVLIFGSSVFRFTRFGSMVFLVHDISDVPVDLCKLANFLKMKTATVLSFVTMVLLWFAFRLIIFPFVIYKSLLTESWMAIGHGFHSIYYYCYVHCFKCLLGLIIVLQIVWFGMFLKIGWVLVTKGETHDLTEHKKGEEQKLEATNGATNGGTRVYHK